MMGFVHRISLAFTAFLVMTTMALSGCTDSFTGYDEADPASAAYDGPKFRHAHLLNRALKPNDGLGKSANNGNHLGLIVGVQPGIDKQRIVDRYKIASRYRVANRYKIATRYEYEHAMHGFAWTIEDSLGGDFQQLFDSLAADPDIQFFEPDIPADLEPEAVVSQPGSGSQLTPPGILRVGGSSHSASSVEVFVLDTGVSNSDVNVVESVDLTDSPSGSNDIDGHGTHIAGTIAAINDQDGVVGVAPGARIHSLKVLPDVDPNPDDGEVDLSTAIAAVEHATGQKLASPNTPMVVNISLGADIGTTQYTALDEAIEASSAAGVVYVVAAGNEGIDASTVTPAHAASAITVGAYDPADDQFVSFSNYGAT